MRSRSWLSGLAVALAVAGVVVGWRTVRATAQPTLAKPAPDPLIGTWAINLSKSKLNGPAPKSHYRTFDYSHDGMIICTNGTVDAQGKSAFGVWEARLDGSEGKEFHRDVGATPSALVYMKRTDPYTIQITAKRNGKVFTWGTFTLSKDGQSLVQSLESYDKNGNKVLFVRAYDKQP
jgi:hypothetical protein